MPSSDALPKEERERERDKKEFEIAKTGEAIFMSEWAAGNNNQRFRRMPK